MQYNHQIIRLAYENTLTACARLASFASGSPTESGDGLINMRQSNLAADDLLLFAINTRRLIDSLDALKWASKTKFRVFYNKDRVEQPITFIANKIIHHKDIKISRFNYDLDSKILYDPNHVIQSFPPIVYVKSDKGDAIQFSLWELIQHFETEVLDPLVEKAAEDRLYLDEI